MTERLDTDLTPRATTLRYLYDPLCGWCYGAAPALAALEAKFPGELQLMPAGLFGPTHRSTREWAAMIWSHDQRIGGLTRQVFSDAYRDRVLGRLDGAFNSGPSTRALTLLAGEGESELAWLARFQTARWIDGHDTGDADVVAAIVARRDGRDAGAFGLRLREEDALVRATDERVRSTRALMRDAGIGGVPAIVVTSASPGSRARVVSGGILYGDPGPLIETIGAFREA